MEKLGDVSGADAIGFLIETQISAALARLDPMFKLQSATENFRSVTGSLTQQQESPQSSTFSHEQTQHQPQDVARSQQLSTSSHAMPQDDAANALDRLLSA